MILLIAVLAGFTTGMVVMWARRQSYRPPDLQYLWLVFLAYLPQFAIIYIPGIRQQVSDLWAAIHLTASQLLLLGFAWLNRKLPGMLILLIGAALNFAVMTANGGFMPISPQTASRIFTREELNEISLGERIGIKDILLEPQDTRFEILADRFLSPAWSTYQVAFSLGDVFLAAGVFWLLARVPGKDTLPERILT
ncbi:MAG: DUF5317 domain-containing protein [Anaerolineales bacterium]|nr:DUF5317 domain-containing protein [Anaerolineales bacterium]